MAIESLTGGSWNTPVKKVPAFIEWSLLSILTLTRKVRVFRSMASLTAVICPFRCVNKLSMLNVTGMPTFIKLA